MVWIYIICAIIALVIFFRYLKEKEKELEASFQKKFSDKNILFMDKHAIFIAQQSDGYSHVRGMGYLVLTDQELYYKRQLGNKVVSIPLTSILKVGETKRLGGQNPGKPMLKVDFLTQEGKEDAVAWSVKELAKWKNKIQMRR